MKEANFAGLCKELYPRLEVADSVFIEALRKHGDEGLAMEEVANWQPWESSADLAAAANPAPPPKEPEVDNIERQRRELEKFERAKKEREEKDREERAKEEAKRREEARREEQIRLEEQAKLEAKAKQEEKVRLAREEEIRRAREEQAILARIEREKAKAEEELKARILKEEEERREKEEKERREKEEKERREKEEKERHEKEEKEKRKREEKEKRDKEEKERRNKEDKEKREREEKDKLEKEKRNKEEKEKWEKEERERIEREVRERLNKEEKEKREKEEREQREKEEKEMREKEEKEKREKEEKEKREKEEKEQREKEEKEKREKEEKEKRENEDKGKDKEDDDKEVRDIIKELQDLKGMNVDFVGENAPPRVSIYVGKDSDLSAADHEQIKNIFLKKEVSEQEIRILDIATDREIQQFLKSSLKRDTLVFPIVCVDGQPIGTPADLFKMESAQIEKLLSSTPEDTLFHISGDDPNSEVHLGALNQVLSAGEYLASGVGSLLMLPVTALTWPFRSAPVDPDQMKGKNDKEFDVIHTNWYWRSQWRIFRFSDTYVARLHPRHKDIRAAHQYDTFRLIQITDSKNIVFHYSDNSPPDYLHAKEEDVKEMVKIVVAKNEKVKVTREESQG